MTNLPYETALKLKEAGFPQTQQTVKCPCLVEGCREFVTIPILEELIEACGDRFSYLHQDSERAWAANSHAEGDMEVYGQERGVGTSPTEAVANLWLALNSK